MDPFSSFGGFEDLFNSLAGRSRSFSSARDSEVLDTIQTKKGTFIIFDFSSRPVTDVSIVDELRTDEYGEELHTGQKMLRVSHSGGESSYSLPKKFKKNKFEWTEKNGIVEVFFGR